MGWDVDGIIQLTHEQFASEQEDIPFDPIIYAYNITQAVVDQFYDPARACVWVARAGDQRMLAYVWAERGQRAPWNRMEFVAAKFVQVAIDLPTRTKLRLCDEIITIWENWAVSIGVRGIWSSSMRRNQEAFLRLHERRGYIRRSSSCYKVLDATTTTPASPLHPD